MLKSTVFTAASVAAIALLSACSTNASQGPTSALPGYAAALPDVAAEFAYEANEGSTNVSGYKIASDGALTPVKGSPFAAGSNPSGVAIDPTGKVAIASNAGSNNTSAFTIDATNGALTQVKGSPFGAGFAPSGVAVDSTGKFAYVANVGVSSSSNVSAYTIGSSGTLTPVKGSPFAAGTSAQYVACLLYTSRCV